MIILAYILSLLNTAPPVDYKSPEQCVAKYEKERFNEASECFHALYEKTKDSAFLYGAAYALYMDRQYKQALKTLRRFRSQAAKKGDAWFLEGLILAKLGHMESARDALGRAKLTGLENETTASLETNMKKVNAQIRATTRPRAELSLSAGYDSKPIAGDLGELVTSGEEPSVFLGLGASFKLPLYQQDLLQVKLLYSGS
ncbi:hypothetical protein KJ865_09560, partial [Myxococcota bacterium]|nr:hypothetical protein [Myxococcota bacterium]